MTFFLLSRSLSNHYAARAACEIKVELCAVCTPEDRALVPDDFRLLRELTTSVKDVAGAQAARKLPLLRDLVDCLVEEIGADLYIYSNVRHRRYAVLLVGAHGDCLLPVFLTPVK